MPVSLNHNLPSVALLAQEARASELELGGPAVGFRSAARVEECEPALGAGGLRFKSGRPDQKYLACILLLIESAVHLKPHLWNSGRQEVWIRKSFSFREFAT
jgi:hypothetical protein